MIGVTAGKVFTCSTTGDRERKPRMKLKLPAIVLALVGVLCFAWTASAQKQGGIGFGLRVEDVRLVRLRSLED